jgi:hypothetical protein
VSARAIRRICGLCGQPFAIVIAPGAEEIERDRLCGDCAALPAPPPEADPGAPDVGWRPPPRKSDRRSRLPAPPTEPELQLLHRWLDNWTGVGLITVGVERRPSLSHIADEEWRAVLMGGNALLAPRGFGVAATPWGAVQMAAWGAMDKGIERRRDLGLM